MKININIPVVLFMTCLLAGCSHFGDTENRMYGITFRRIEDVPQFRKYRDIGGSLIYEPVNKHGEDEFAIAHIKKGDKDVLIFEKLVKDLSTPSHTKFEILDTLNINNVKKNEFITYCNCRVDSTPDPEIIAWVVEEGDAEFNKVIKAWRANKRTGTITLIKDTRGINCINESYWLGSQ